MMRGTVVYANVLLYIIDNMNDHKSVFMNVYTWPYKVKCMVVYEKNDGCLFKIN